MESADPVADANPLKKTEYYERVILIVDGTTAGDPCSGQRWTRATTQSIATALEADGIYICDRTVSRILKELGYALRVNHKQLSATKHPQRNQQFQLIALLRNYAFLAGIPIISVDTKKKEYAGIKISKEQMDQLNLIYNEFCPQWNYTINPGNSSADNMPTLEACLDELKKKGETAAP